MGKIKRRGKRDMPIKNKAKRYKDRQKSRHDGGNEVENPKRERRRGGQSAMLVYGSWDGHAPIDN